jgi:hypothetical protein
MHPKDRPDADHRNHHLKQKAHGLMAYEKASQMGQSKVNSSISKRIAILTASYNHLNESAYPSSVLTDL